MPRMQPQPFMKQTKWEKNSKVKEKDSSKSNNNSNNNNEVYNLLTGLSNV